MSTPVTVRVRMYQVGFGDCFLVTVEYDEPLPDGRTERHLLIDYGATRSAREGRAKGRMRDVAALIEEHTHGVLDVLALTHRHKDHLSGFGDSTGAATLHRLAPALVLRPGRRSRACRRTRGRPAMLSLIADGQAFAASVVDRAARQAEEAAPTSCSWPRTSSPTPTPSPSSTGWPDPPTRTASSSRLATRPVSTTSSRASASASWVHPLPKDWPAVENQARTRTSSGSAPAQQVARLFTARRDRHPVPPGPIALDRRPPRRQRAAPVARLVRRLDDALNNTSVILLFRPATRTLLFPGDAQIENWEYALDHAGTATPTLAAGSRRRPLQGRPPRQPQRHPP